MAGRMIMVGRLQVATPESMALAIRQGTVAQVAVDERIEPIAVDIIKSDSTIIAGAAAAVGDALAAESVLTGALPVSPRHGKALILAVGDRALASWNRSDGLLDDDTADAFGRRIGDVGSVGVSRRLGSRHPWSHVWAAGDRVVMYLDKSDGVLKSFDGTPIGGAGGTTFTLRADGDSTTMGADLANMFTERWTTILGNLIGTVIDNAGISGNRAADIGTMAGSFLATATVSGGTIPAQGGTVTVTTSTSPFYGTRNNVPTGVQADLYRPDGTRIRGVIVGTSSESLTFTRTSPGDAIAANTVQLQVVNGKTYRSGIRFFAAGINDEPAIVAGTTTIEQVKDRYREFVTAQAGEAWTWGLLNRGLNEGGGDAAARAKIMAYLAEMDSFLTGLFGVRYIPVARYLGTQQALADAAALQPGFTPTQADSDTVAAGLIPPSFRSSSGSVHLNALGHQLQAMFMATRLRQFSIHSERFAA